MKVPKTHDMSSPSSAKGAFPPDAPSDALRHVKKTTSDYESDLPADLAERWNERFKIRVKHDIQFKVQSTHLPQDYLRLSFPGTLVDVRDLYLYKRVRDRRFALHVAIAKGEKDVVDRILEIDAKLLEPEDAFRCAVRFSQVKMAEWLFPQVSEHQRSNWVRELDRMLVATEFNLPLTIEVVETLHRLGFSWDGLVYQCAQFGDAVLLDYLYSKREYASLSELLLQACKLRHADLVKRAIQDHGFERFNSWVEASETTSEFAEFVVDCVMVSSGVEYSRDLNPWALQAINDINPAVVDRLKHFEGFALNDDAWSYALRIGHPGIIRHFLGTRKDTKVLFDFETIFAHELRLVELLKSSGHAIENIRPATVEVARYLAQNGVQFQDDILMTVLEHWDKIEKTWTDDARKAVADLVHFILETLPEISVDVEPERLLAKHGCVELTKFFRRKTENTYMYPLVQSALVGGDYLGLFDYFTKEEGGQIEESAIFEAMRNNRADALHYILCHLGPSCDIRRPTADDKYDVDILVQAKNVEQITKHDYLDIIVDHGQLELVKEWIEADSTKFGVRYLQGALAASVESGLVHIFKYLWPKYLEAYEADPDARQFCNSASSDEDVFRYEAEESFEVELTKHINHIKAQNPFSGPWAEIEALVAKQKEKTQ